MIHNRPENCWEDYLLSEGADGTEVWTKKTPEKVNPYGKGGQGRYRSKIPDRRTAPDKDGKTHAISWRTTREEKGYTWELGYNHLIGRPTQGQNRNEMQGSSLNRKKPDHGENEVLLSTADYIAQMALQTAIKHSNQYTGSFMGPDNKRENVSSMLSRIYIALSQDDLDYARKLTVWFRQSLRGLSSGVSFGIHMLSARSRGKIKDKATAFYRACPGRRVFCTLTFIATVDDRTGQVVLNKFLTQARKQNKGLQYFWVAERQENSNIHFHVILNKKLPVGRWNALWVLCQYNSGLIGKTQWGEEISKTKLLQAYYEDYAEGFRKKRIQALLNPLDVRKVSSIGQLSNYLTKYITKQKKNEPFHCSVWHCSRGVSRLFTRQTVSPSTFRYMLSLENVRMDKTTGEVFEHPREVKIDGCPFVRLVYVLDKVLPLRYLKKMEQVNRWLLDGFEPDRLREIDDGEYSRLYVSKN
jgi:hypothetical protein